MSIKNFGFAEIKDKATKIPLLWKKFQVLESFPGFLARNEFAPLIGTICDEQINSEDAWNFPEWLYGKLRKFDLPSLLKADYERLLDEYLKDKWPTRMQEETKKKYIEKTSRAIRKALGMFQEEQKSPISMFQNRPYSALETYFILRRIPGFGPKKSNMITRDFIYRSLDLSKNNAWFDQIKAKLPNFKVVDERFLDMPIDVHVVKVFNRIFGRKFAFRGGWRKELVNHIQDILAFSKLAFPDFPAKLDQILWTVGRENCHERDPDCEKCPIAEICESANSF